MRIPAEYSDAFVSGLGQLGTIVSQSESAEAVTLQYSDTESRIESLQTEQERLLDLLKQALSDWLNGLLFICHIKKTADADGE